MNCPSGIKTLYINSIYYLKTMTIEQVPAMWKSEIQSAIDELKAKDEKELQEKLAALEEAHQKLESEAKNDPEEEETTEDSEVPPTTTTTTSPSEEEEVSEVQQ